MIRIGETFRARGGPTYHESRVGRPGLYRLVAIERGRNDRVYLLGQSVDKAGLPNGGTMLLYVEGKPYRLAGLSEWIVRPYRVNRSEPKAQADVCKRRKAGKTIRAAMLK